MTHIVPKPGFDWNKVAWGRPDSPPRRLCAYCAGPLPEAPLMVWKSDGSGASFCDRCTERWFGVKTFSEQGGDYGRKTMP
jgi:hypothetical protein